MRFGLLLAFLFLTSCNYWLGQPTGADNPVGEVKEKPGNVLVPAFSSIQALILNKRCVSCHSSTGRADHIPLTTFEEIMNSPRELVIPELPEESGIVISIQRTDDKRMPSEGPALTGTEIETIVSWIENGALND